MDHYEEQQSYQEQKNIPPDKEPPYPSSPNPNALATASLIMGILSLVTLCCIYGGLIFGSLGLAFSLLSRGKNKRFSEHAKAGLILSIIALSLLALLFLFSLFIILTDWPEFSPYIDEYYRNYTNFYSL